MLSTAPCIFILPGNRATFTVEMFFESVPNFCSFKFVPVPLTVLQTMKGIPIIFYNSSPFSWVNIFCAVFIINEASRGVISSGLLAGGGGAIARGAKVNVHVIGAPK